MLAGPLFLRCAKIRKAFVFKSQKAHLFQIWKINTPTAPKVPVEPVSKKIAQHLLCIILCCKLQGGIDGIIPERQVQDLKHRMA